MEIFAPTPKLPAWVCWEPEDESLLIWLSNSPAIMPSPESVIENFRPDLPDGKLTARRAKVYRRAPTAADGFEAILGKLA